MRDGGGRGAQGMSADGEFVRLGDVDRGDLVEQLRVHRVLLEFEMETLSTLIRSP